MMLTTGIGLNLFASQILGAECDKANRVYLYVLPKVQKKEREERSTSNTYISLKRYTNDEVTCVPVRLKMIGEKEVKSKREKGDKVKQNGFSRRQASKVKRSVRVLAEQSKNNSISFLTLTFGKDVPDDKTAKKLMVKFLDKLKYKHYKDEDFYYLWVAEKQKRGAIHFHIVFEKFISKGNINAYWNKIVQKWQKQNGFRVQNITGSKIVGKKITRDGTGAIQSYMTKPFANLCAYLTKLNKSEVIDEKQTIDGLMWNSSQCLKNLIKPVQNEQIEVSKRDIQDAVNDAAIELLTVKNIVPLGFDIGDNFTGFFAETGGQFLIDYFTKNYRDGTDTS